MRIRAATRPSALAILACVGLPTSALADGGDTPGTGPVITQAQLEAGVTLTGATSGSNSNARDSGHVPLTDCRDEFGRDEWYTLNVTEAIAIDIDVCTGTTFDAKLYLVDATDTIIYCWDNSCGLQPRVRNLTLTPGLYELAIDGVTGYGTPIGSYEVEIVPHDPASCVLDQPCNGIPEGEPCDPLAPDTTNGGCSSTLELFQSIEPEGTRCGTTWATGGSADSDWYLFLPQDTFEYRLTLHSEVDAVAFLVELAPGGDPCSSIDIVPGCLAYSGHCDSNTVLGRGVVEAGGGYAVVVMPGTPGGQPIIDGFPCPVGGTNNAFSVHLDYQFFGENFCALAGWDINGDNFVDFGDILEVIANWGPCDVAPETGCAERSAAGGGSAGSAVVTSAGVGGDTPGSGAVLTGAQIMAGPVMITGDTSDNTDQFDVGPVIDPPTDCGASTAPDEWYTIHIDGATGPLDIDIDLCNTSSGGGGTLYDSKIFVLDAVNVPLQCNDETGCASPSQGASAILNLRLDPGTYELAIDGFGTASGLYEGEVRLFQPVMCFLDPPCTGPLEGEPCDMVAPDNFNGGCNSTPEAFSVAQIDQAVCGTNWANNGTRDTDWWAFSTTRYEAFELCLRAETDTTAFFAEMSPGGVCPVVGIPSGTPAFTGDCDTVNVIGDGYVLDPGDYIMFVGNGTAAGGGVHDGFPCTDGATTNNAYEVEIARDSFIYIPCEADLTDDQTVDFADLLVVLAHWGPCSPPPPTCFPTP